MKFWAPVMNFSTLSVLFCSVNLAFKFFKNGLIKAMNSAFEKEVLANAWLYSMSITFSPASATPSSSSTPPKAFPHPIY